jgi:hypothetical protein
MMPKRVSQPEIVKLKPVLRPALFVLVLTFFSSYKGLKFVLRENQMKA